MPWSSISEARETMVTAKSVRLLCPHCSGHVHVMVPWNAEPMDRQRLISAAINEHRVICTGADATEGRVYTIEYPRL